MVQAATPDMDALGGGSIVAIYTQASEEMPIPGWGGYLTSKAAMQMLVACAMRQKASSRKQKIGRSNYYINFALNGFCWATYKNILESNVAELASWNALNCVMYGSMKPTTSLPGWARSGNLAILSKELV